MWPQLGPCAVRVCSFLEQPVLQCCSFHSSRRQCCFFSFQPYGKQSLLLSIASPLSSPKVSFSSSGLQFSRFTAVLSLKLPALSLDTLAARVAFHLKLPQLQQVILMDHISPGSRGNAFSFVLRAGSPADPLSLLPFLPLRPFQKRHLQGVWGLLLLPWGGLCMGVWSDTC